jgi:hypothetical protein
LPYAEFSATQRILMRIQALFFLLSALLFPATGALATSNYEYGPDEYVTIAKGFSPDGKYAITAHGEGELGDENFHLFLTDAVAGKKLAVLKEIVDTLDTGANAFCAKWSKDSDKVVIIYRIDRHLLNAASYTVSNGRARLVEGPSDVTSQEQISYWHDQCSDPKQSEKIFGTPKAH